MDQPGGVRGEVKIYLDGDKDFPTLVGTGTEDYPGSGYGLGRFDHLYQGCTHADGGRIAFYRYHLNDPVYFYRDCKVTLQQMGSANKKDLLSMREKGALVKAVSGIKVKDNAFYPLLDDACPVRLESDILSQEDGVCFYRQDDWCATAYFYLESPENGLEPLASCKERIDGVL